MTQLEYATKQKREFLEVIGYGMFLGYVDVTPEKESSLQKSLAFMMEQIEITNR